MEQASGEGEEAGDRGLLQGHGKGSENHQDHQAESAQIGRRRAERDQHSGGESPGSRHQDGSGVMMPAQGAPKHGETNKQARREHSPGALAVGLLAVGKSDVQRAGSDNDSAGKRSEGDAGGERQSNAQRVPQGQPRVNLVALVAEDSLPKGRPSVGMRIVWRHSRPYDAMHIERGRLHQGLMV